MKKKLFILPLLALSFLTLASCFDDNSSNIVDKPENVKDVPDNKSNNTDTTSEDKKDDTSDKDKEIVKPTEKTESEIRVEL
ncbi:MAG: hypothetical protein K6F81_02730, partial [Acholeplasmatales bacterium]|nr:hypothetical protein [Acholeplasmatales bacterium]